MGRACSRCGAEIATGSWPNLEEQVAIEDELFGSSDEDLSTKFSAPIDQVFELTWNFNGCRRTMWLPNGISFERLRDRIAWKLQKEVTVIRMLARGRVIDLSSTIPNGFSSTVHVVLEQHGGGVVDPQWIASDALAAWPSSASASGTDLGHTTGSDGNQNAFKEKHVLYANEFADRLAVRRVCGST